MSPGKIRALRERTGLSQTAFANLVGVHYVTENRWENGQSFACFASSLSLRRLNAALDHASLTEIVAALKDVPCNPTSRAEAFAWWIKTDETATNDTETTS